MQVMRLLYGWVSTTNILRMMYNIPYTHKNTLHSGGMCMYMQHSRIDIMGWYLRLYYMPNLYLHYFFFLPGLSLSPNVLVGACMPPMLWVLIQFDIRLRSNALSRRIRSVSMVSGSESIGIATVCTNVWPRSMGTEYFIRCNAVISVMCGSSNSVETNASRCHLLLRVLSTLPIMCVHPRSMTSMTSLLLCLFHGSAVSPTAIPRS